MGRFSALYPRQVAPVVVADFMSRIFGVPSTGMYFLPSVPAKYYCRFILLLLHNHNSLALRLMDFIGRGGQPLWTG